MPLFSHGNCHTLERNQWFSSQSMEYCEQVSAPFYKPKPPAALPAFHESRDHAKLQLSSVICDPISGQLHCFSLCRPSPSPTPLLVSPLSLLLLQADPARCSCGYFLLLDQSQAGPGRFSYFYLPFLSEWFSWFFPIVAFSRDFAENLLHFPSLRIILG